MVNKYIYNNNNLIIYEKLNKIYNINISNVYLKKLKITLIIPSNSNYINGFVTMLVLFEKNINNKPIFLLDYNTLSRNRTIKIGLIINVYGEILYQYLHLCMEYSILRIVENNIIFNIPLSHIHYFYNNNKILYNTIFSFDKNIYLYYMYLNNLSYILEFNFNTTSKHKLVNQLIISTINEQVVIEEDIIKDTLNDKAVITALEEETNEYNIDKDIEYLLENDIIKNISK